MKIGILGSGNIGGRLGVQWAKAGHDVVFSSRHPEKLTQLIDATGSKARAATPSEAAAHGELILLAVPYWMLDDVLQSAGALDGKIIIDATNPYTRDFKGWAVPDDTTALAELQKRLPSARVVKAFNSMAANVLSEQAHRQAPYVVFLSGDDAGAKRVVADLIRETGFDPYDLGGGAQAALHEPRGPLYTKSLTRAEADQVLSGLPVRAAGR